MEALQQSLAAASFEANRDSITGLGATSRPGALAHQQRCRAALHPDGYFDHLKITREAG
jgi:hypothetical protein